MFETGGEGAGVGVGRGVAVAILDVDVTTFRGFVTVGVAGCDLGCGAALAAFVALAAGGAGGAGGAGTGFSARVTSAIRGVLSMRLGLLGGTGILLALLPELVSLVTFTGLEATGFGKGVSGGGNRRSTGGDAPSAVPPP